MERRYKLIEYYGKHYLADLNYYKLRPVDNIFREIFELLESQTEEQIIHVLSNKYPEQEIHNHIQWTHQLYRRTPIKKLAQFITDCSKI